MAEQHLQIIAERAKLRLAGDSVYYNKRSARRQAVRQVPDRRLRAADMVHHRNRDHRVEFSGRKSALLYIQLEDFGLRQRGQDPFSDFDHAARGIHCGKFSCPAEKGQRPASGAAAGIQDFFSFTGRQFRQVAVVDLFQPVHVAAVVRRPFVPFFRVIR